MLNHDGKKEAKTGLDLHVAASNTLETDQLLKKPSRGSHTSNAMSSREARRVILYGAALEMIWRRKCFKAFFERGVDGQQGETNRDL